MTQNALGTHFVRNIKLFLQGWKELRQQEKEISDAIDRDGLQEYLKPQKTMTQQPLTDSERVGILSKQIGKSVSCDFSKNTWTFEMPEEFVFSAGKFKIIPINE